MNDNDDLEIEIDSEPSGLHPTKSDFFIKSMPLEQWKAIQAELAQLRAMKSALDRVHELFNPVCIYPLQEGRAEVIIFDKDYITVPTVTMWGETLTEAIEKALAEYERLSQQ